MTMQDTHTNPSLESEVKALRAELAELRAEVKAAKSPAGPTAMSPTGGTSNPEKPELVIVDGVTDRRQMLRRAGIGAAAAVAGGAALAMTQASPAAAVNGSNLIIGNTANNASATTTLTTSAAGNTGIFVVQDANYIFSVYKSAVNGWTDGTAANNGVYGFSGAMNGYGVVGNAGGTGGVGVFASGDDVDLRLGGLGTEPVQGVPSRGGFAFTAADNLWFCPVNAAGNWFKLAGPGVAGSLHMLTAPKRVYDSRLGTVPANPNKIKWADHDERVIDASFNASGVASGARAVLMTATATNTNPGGYFSFWKSGVWTSTSSLNWGSVNSTVATTTVVAIDAARSFKGRMEGAGGADLIVDIVGYYL